MLKFEDVNFLYGELFNVFKDKTLFIYVSNNINYSYNLLFCDINLITFFLPCYYCIDSYF